jgi:hypothetical protein
VFLRDALQELAEPALAWVAMRAFVPNHRQVHWREFDRNWLDDERMIFGHCLGQPSGGRENEVALGCDERRQDYVGHPQSDAAL